MEQDLHIDQHISKSFNSELENLRSKVLVMGGLVERQCKNALGALIEGDAALAEVVASSDQQVNELELEINAQCMDILARRQPTASDLRLILSVIRLISDLERIGDEAEKIGRLALHLADDHREHSFYAEPGHLGESVLDMLRGSLDAFARLDVRAAILIACRDHEIDTELESLTRLLVTHMMEEPQRVQNMLRVNWCARALERIGDHSVNICEEVVFLVKGSNVRHMPVEEVRSRFLGNS